LSKDSELKNTSDFEDKIVSRELKKKKKKKNNGHRRKKKQRQIVITFNTPEAETVFATTVDGDGDGSNEGIVKNGDDIGNGVDCARPPYSCFYRRFFGDCESTRNVCKANTLGYCQQRPPERPPA
jgi:hypothetical protein